MRADHDARIGTPLGAGFTVAVLARAGVGEDAAAATLRHFLDHGQGLFHFLHQLDEARFADKSASSPASSCSMDTPKERIS